MTFDFPCHHCGHDNSATWSRVGKGVSCDGCGRMLTVPAPRDVVDADDEPPAMVRFFCPSCARKYATKAELAGKKIKCSGCGGGVRVPTGDAGTVAAPARPALRTIGGTEGATTA